MAMSAILTVLTFTPVAVSATTPPPDEPVPTEPTSVESTVPDTSAPETTVPDDTTTTAVVAPAAISVGSSPFATGVDVVGGLAGTPQPPTVAWSDDLEASQANTGPVLAGDYIGADSTAYRADGAQLASCAGLIIGHADEQPADAACDWSTLQTLADALGQWGSSPDPQSNHVVTSLAGLATSTDISVTPNHFYTVAVDTAFVGCAAAQPKIELSVGGKRASATPIDVCANPDKAVGDIAMRTVFGDTPVLVTGDTTTLSIGVSGAAVGALDNIRLIDVTPQLDIALDGTTSELTYTITNATDLAGKPNFSFTTTLPDGLTVSDPSKATTDCADGVITADSGSSTIAIAAGLASGVESCTSTVSVASADEGSYAIGADQLSDVVGVRAPAASEQSRVSVVAAEPEVEAAVAAAPAAIGAPVPPWVCATNSPGLLFQNPTGSTALSVTNIDLVTGDPTLVLTIPGAVVNAVGFNVQDLSLIHI